MISKFLKKHDQPFRNIYFIHNSFSKFCSSIQKQENYFANKQRKQKQKQILAYRNRKDLKILQLNMKQLVPNFFTRRLPLHFSQAVPTQNKQINYINNSFIQLEIPIASKPQLQLHNVLRKLNTQNIRIGRIMEIMDSVAGIVGYKHCYGSFNVNQPNPFVLVTGCVDSINLFEDISSCRDLVLEGYINYAGSTSMEIEINLYQQQKLKANALFAMISRNADNHLKGYKCPKISFEGLQIQEKQKAMKRYSIAEKNIQRRKKQIVQSYDKQPPKQKDIAIIHDFFLKHRKMSNSQKIVRTIESTVVNNTLLMHLQERNVHNKIFGGFLMRQMFETAWIAGNRFLQGRSFQIEDITNIYFTAPVQIGSQLQINAKVTFCQGPIIVVNVEAYTFRNQYRQEKLCCHCNVFIKTQNIQEQTIYPLTYQNAILHLSSKNSFEQLFK